MLILCVFKYFGEHFYIYNTNEYYICTSQQTQIHSIDVLCHIPQDGLLCRNILEDKESKPVAYIFFVLCWLHCSVTICQKSFFILHDSQ
jgi:hypothetical protein